MRQDQPLAILGQPDIHSGIGCSQAIQTQAIMPGDIRQRIPAFKTDVAQAADDVFLLGNRKLVLLKGLFLFARS